MNQVVTVLIPCNSIVYLEECLESISLQTYPNFEVLIILNGQAILDHDHVVFMGTKLGIKLRVLISEAQNISDALNEGLVKCDNELIARMDADDLMLPDRLESQVNAMSNQSIVAVGTQIVRLYSNKN